MKKLMLIIILSGMAGWAFGQANQIPDIVKKKFAAIYPDVKEVDWHINNQWYEVHYVFSDLNKSALFDQAGNLVEVSTITNNFCPYQKNCPWINNNATNVNQNQRFQCPNLGNCPRFNRARRLRNINN